MTQPQGGESGEPWTPGRIDRITEDYDGDGIDEIVLTGVTVHLERMDDQRYYLGIWDPNNPSTVRLSVSIGCAPGRRKKVKAVVYDNEGLDAVPMDDGVYGKPAAARVRQVGQQQ